MLVIRFSCVQIVLLPVYVLFVPVETVFCGDRQMAMERLFIFYVGLIANKRMFYLV